MREIVKMSRRLEKMPVYFQNFVVHHRLWPQLDDKSVLVKEFSVKSIEQDIRGHNIKKWHQVVNPLLTEYGAHLEYIRASSKQHLIFPNAQAKLWFVMRWS